ncbi:MAG: hypothetical protein ACLTBV_30005 [Enterocloster bolteae]
MPAVIRFGYGFVQGAEFAAGEGRRITGLEISPNYTVSAFSRHATRRQSMAASWYQNGTGGMSSGAA